jgi:hypothetical protein
MHSGEVAVPQPLSTLRKRRTAAMLPRIVDSSATCLEGCTNGATVFRFWAQTSESSHLGTAAAAARQ